MLLIEIPVAILLVLTLAIRGWGSADEQTGTPTMDWVPVLWLGGFTLGVLVIAVVFLYSAHPFAGAVQLLIAAIALIFTMTAWHGQYERAHRVHARSTDAKAHGTGRIPGPAGNRHAARARSWPAG
ncbi:DUF6234 family protein [Streptomyces cyslabdanicus]|uniref:DUF6234 family protein n=1 Tax=Streptomyces cyslabdanicus TaxID=1470456 RepID=UPI0040449B45